MRRTSTSPTSSVAQLPSAKKRWNVRMCFHPTALAARTTPVTVCRPIANTQPLASTTNVPNDGAVKHLSKNWSC